MTTAVRLRGRSNVPDLIAARTPFRTASLRAEVVRDSREVPRGRLPYPAARVLSDHVDAASQAGGQTYVVIDYDTPIAWTTPDGDLAVPDVTYTRTTSRHQALCRAARRRTDR